MLRRIGAEEGGEFKAVASGTLPSGKPVVVNADGTVSVVSSSTASVGSSVVYSSTTNTGISASAFDSSNNKVVITYRDSSNNGKAVVGTVSGSSISFGTPVTYYSGTVNDEQGIVFDTNANKFVVIYSRGGTGKAIVGTVSGTSISFGSEAEFDNQQGTYIGITFDSTNNKVVMVYTGTNNYITTRVGTVSGTSISFGTEVVAMSLAADQNTITFDSNRGKVVVCSRVSTKGRAAVGTVSGTSISFASNVIFADNQTKYIAPTFDTTNNKVVIAFINGSSTDQGQAVVGDIDSSGVISFGSAVTYNSEIEELQGIAFDSNVNKVVIAYDSKATDKGQVISGTVSGTSITFDSETVFSSSGVEGVSVAFDSNANKSVIAYKDAGNGNRGTGIVFTPGSTTLTSENYIGMSRGVNFQTGSAASAGTAVAFVSGEAIYNAAVFDSNSNKVVIAYRNSSSGDNGFAVVGTVSGSSISFGTPVAFNSGSSSTNHISMSFDSNLNKVVIAYQDGGNSSYGTAIVGTVAGNDISFGTEVVFESANTDSTAIAYDANAQKHVIFYRDNGDAHGKGIVGTVSGTSISFGSAVQFSSNTNPVRMSPVYDSNAQKIVLAWRAAGASNVGRAAVATVSGTSVSFGSTAVYDSGQVEDVTATFDSSNNKVVVVARDKTNDAGKAYVGTVSGTNITFGSAVQFVDGSSSDVATNPKATFDSNLNRVVIAYKDSVNSDYGTAISGTVSGTSITFDTATVFEQANTLELAATFDSNSNKSVFAYRDVGTNYGTAVTFTPTTLSTTQGQVTNGQAASIDIIGSVSDNQISLTAGQQYFVQTDGTISTTAGSPSVLAGTAISATELVVKT